MTDGAQRMAAKGSSGRCRAARVETSSTPNAAPLTSVTSGHGRPRASTTSSCTTLMTLAHPASIP